MGRRKQNLHTPQTVRMDADAQRVISAWNGRTAKSVSWLVNHMIVTAQKAMNGFSAEVTAFHRQLEAAEQVHAMEHRHDEQLRAARAKERKAAAGIKPLHLAEIPKKKEVA